MATRADCLSCSLALVEQAEAAFFSTLLVGLAQNVSDGIEVLPKTLTFGSTTGSVCTHIYTSVAEILADAQKFSSIGGGGTPCGVPDPGEVPCSSKTAPFDPGHPTCVALIDDVVAAVLPQLEPGPIGPIGPIGFTGATGATGPFGPEGPIGLQGLQGLIGPIGLQGLRGLLGLLGPRGPRGEPGVFSLPRTGTEFAANISALAIQVGRLLQRRAGSGGSIPARPEALAAQPAVETFQLERVGSGGTVQEPVIKGSTSDPTGTLRPVIRPFHATPAGRAPGPPIPPAPTPAAPGRGAQLARILEILLALLLRRRQEQQARDQARRIRQIAIARRDAFVSLERSLRGLLGGRAMGFGQSGFFGGLTGGITDILGAAAPFAPALAGLFGGGARQQQVGFPALPGVFGGALGGALGQGFAELGGGLLGPGSPFGFLGGGETGAAPGQLFRPTVSRIMPVNEFAVIGPDGKCHTWLHATPKGWKINKSNVTGRRRHHHHPR